MGRNERLHRVFPRWSPLLALLVCVGCVLFVAPPAAAQQVPSQMLNQYRNQRITWMTNVWPFANNLFFWLALIEFTWSAVLMVLEKTDLQSWTACLLRKIMWIGAFYALLINGRNWIPTIVDSFNILGQQASGTGPMSPSDVFMRGLNVAGALMDGASSSAFLTNPGTSLACVLAAALTVLAFIGITIQFVVAMVESYIIVAAGMIFLGFGGSRWTAPYVERYIGLGVSNGVKIMLLYLLIGVGMNISLDWIPNAQAVATSASPAMDAFEVMGASLIFLMLCWQIPKLFSAVLGGSPALTGGDLLATGTAVVAGTAAVGSLAAGAVGVAAGGAAAASGAAAGAGSGSSGAGASVMSVGSATGVGGSSRSSGGGAVPPPYTPPSSGPPSNGRPKQPDPPPFDRGSGGAAVEPAGVASNGSGATSHNGSHSASDSEGSTDSNGRAAISSSLGSVGGDNLAGSGFESERPASGFAPVSVTTRSSQASIHSTIDPPPPPNAPRAGVRGRAEVVEPPSGVAPTANSSSASHGVTPEVVSVSSNLGSGAVQPPAQGRRERFGSTARQADRIFSNASNRLRGTQNQLGGVPSDAAPHTPPPHMPINDND
jgi:type IV secretion system protein TrbL